MLANNAEVQFIVHQHSLRASSTYSVPTCASLLSVEERNYRIGVELDILAGLVRNTARHVVLSYLIGSNGKR